MKSFVNSQAPQPRIPSSFELAEVIDNVLSDWAFFSASPAGKPAEGPAALPVEYIVSLKGPLSCTMVLRSNPEFAAELAQASTGDPAARVQGEDAFKELCNLVASHLCSAFFCGDELKFEPFLPLPSSPDFWPSWPASSESVMVVERFPLEARLWVEFYAGSKNV